MVKIKKIQKTRITFIVSLIILTITSISWLFYIDPDTHSVDNYKASILNSYSKIAWKEIDTEKSQSKNKEEESAIMEDEKVVRREEEKISNEMIEIEELDIWWSIIRIEKIISWSWWEIKYKLDWKVFNNRESLDKEVENIINKNKELKIKNYILDKYANN